MKSRKAKKKYPSALNGGGSGENNESVASGVTSVKMASGGVGEISMAAESMLEKKENNQQCRAAMAESVMAMKANMATWACRRKMKSISKNMAHQKAVAAWRGEENQSASAARRALACWRSAGRKCNKRMAAHHHRRRMKAALCRRRWHQWRKSNAAHAA
jgi:hypothetical protein